MPDDPTKPAPAAAPDPDALPPHEILGPIAQAPNPIYRAQDVRNDRVVALKCFSPSFLGPENIEAFLREARAAAHVRHPHLLPILAVGLFNGMASYTTPLAVSGALAERRGQFREPGKATALVEKLAWATAAAHAHGLVHGDLKPSAILFDEHDEPMIAGLGHEPLLLSRTVNHVLGNPAYCAPERLTGAGGVDASIDVWALGVMLYELLTGRRPFEDGGLEIASRIQADAPAPPRRLRPDLDRRLEAVVLRCLEKRPADRYPSARALAEDLERWRQAQPTAARPQTWAGRLLRRLARALGSSVP